jgi:hypothetical protein
MKWLLLVVGAWITSGNDGMARVEPTLSPPAPAAVTDLSARPLTDSAIVLQWTEVRSSSTAIPRYVVRYGLLGAFQWTTSPDLLSGGCAAPIVGSNATGGRFHACVVWNLLPNQAYQFQMVAYTGVLNSTAVFGPLSNIAEATTMQRIGPLLVVRPRMFLDTIQGVQRLSVPGWGSWAFYAKATFGDYQGTLEDSSGAILARGYLLLVHP